MCNQEGLKILSRNCYKQILNQETKYPSLICQDAEETEEYKCFISHTWLVSWSCSWRFLTISSSAGIAVPRGIKGRASSCISRASFNSACSLKFKGLNSVWYLSNTLSLNELKYCTFDLYVPYTPSSLLNPLSKICSIKRV